jgi:hypothetical protein
MLLLLVVVELMVLMVVNGIIFSMIGTALCTIVDYYTRSICGLEIYFSAATIGMIWCWFGNCDGWNLNSLFLMEVLKVRQSWLVILGGCRQFTIMIGRVDSEKDVLLAPGMI